MREKIGVESGTRRVSVNCEVQHLVVKRASRFCSSASLANLGTLSQMRSSGTVLSTPLEIELDRRHSVEPHRSQSRSSFHSVHSPEAFRTRSPVGSAGARLELQSGCDLAAASSQSRSCLSAVPSVRKSAISHRRQPKLLQSFITLLSFHLMSSP